MAGDVGGLVFSIVFIYIAKKSGSPNVTSFQKNFKKSLNAIKNVIKDK